MAKNGGKFLLGGLLAAAAGAIGGLLLAPKSGKETRKDIAKLALNLNRTIRTEAAETKERVKEVFGEVSDEATNKYKAVRDGVVSRIASLKTAGTSIDREKYEEVVDEVVANFKGVGAKIAVYLKKDWSKIKKALS